MMRFLYQFSFTVAVCGILGMAGCSKSPSAEQGRDQAVPVTVATVEQKTVPIELNGFGTVEEYAGVAVKAQVTGILTAVHFTEGQMVKKGDLLLSIDPRSFEAALKLVQANLAKDEVQLKNAEKEATRQEDLLKKGFASQADYDNAVTTAEALRATVDADKALVENAALQLEYCSIRSPIDGTTGKLAVEQGNLVKLNDITVVTINQIVPIYVSFSFRQESLPQIQDYMSKGKLEVIAAAKGDKPQVAHGYLSFVDNTVDTNTGTIRLRATFTNEDKSLWPGQFVQVSLVLTNEPNAIIVPSQAIQTGQSGQFIYVVKSDQTVEARPVTTRRIINSETVVDGLKVDETVVTDGQLRLVPGAKVQIKHSNHN
jgi:membrane fusion protein, multidrug efflux system